MKVLVWILKLPVKAFALLILAVVTVFVVLTKLIKLCSSVVGGGLMILTVGMMVYYAWHGQWQLALLSLVLGTLFVLGLFAVELVVRLTEALQGLIGKVLTW